MPLRPDKTGRNNGGEPEQGNAAVCNRQTGLSIFQELVHD